MERLYTYQEISNAIASVDKTMGWECTVERVVNLLYPTTHEVEIDLRQRTKAMLLK